VSRKAILLFTVASTVWGSSFLSIRVAVEHMAPSMVVFGRTLLGACFLVPLAARTGAFHGLRRAGVGRHRLNARPIGPGNASSESCVVGGMSSDVPDPAAPPLQYGAARRRLMADREDTVRLMGGLRRELAQIIDANALVAVDDEHDPEGSSTAFERAQVASLLAQSQDHLEELDRALDRWERGEYGRCQRCREPIPPERLEARPAATLCVPCASARLR
jgi:DnaK suppressor protein